MLIQTVLFFQHRNSLMRRQLLLDAGNGFSRVEVFGAARHVEVAKHTSKAC